MARIVHSWMSQVTTMAKTSKTTSTNKITAPVKPIWIDATGYGRNERGVTEPRTWRLGETGIVVTRYTGLPGWYVRSHIDGIDLHEMKSAEIDAAKAEAIVLVRNIRARRIAELDSL